MRVFGQHEMRVRHDLQKSNENPTNISYNFFVEGIAGVVTEE